MLLCWCSLTRLLSAKKADGNKLIKWLVIVNLKIIANHDQGYNFVKELQISN